MANTIIGKIHSIGQTVNVSKKENPFYKRELVLNASRFDPYTGEERKNYLTFSLTQKNCEKASPFKVGDLVEVAFILQGREYTKDNQTKYITDVVAYDIVAKGENATSAPKAPAAPEPQAPAAPAAAQASNDMPF